MRQLYSSNNIFEELYAKEKPIYSLPTYKHGKFKHNKKVLVATLKAKTDGQKVKVYETRLPARFFTIEVLPGKNSIGALKKGYTLSTGTGMEELTGEIAMAIANGMLGLTEE